MNLELTGRCAGYGAPGAMFRPQPGILSTRQDHYCSRCAHLNDEFERARVNLLEAVRPVVMVWREHWLGRGMSPSVLLEVLYGDDIEKLLRELDAADPREKADNDLLDGSGERHDSQTDRP